MVDGANCNFAMRTETVRRPSRIKKIPSPRTGELSARSFSRSIATNFMLVNQPTMRAHAHVRTRTHLGCTCVCTLIVAAQKQTFCFLWNRKSGSIYSSAYYHLSFCLLLPYILGCQISPFRFFPLYSMLYKKCYSDRI